MKYFIKCTLLFFIFFASANEKYYYADHARVLRQEAAEEMCKRHKFLRVFGYGGGMIDEVRFVAMHFSSSRKLKENEMRDLLVESTLLLQNKINNSQKLRPYLSCYPFDNEGIEVAIFIHSKEMSLDELSYAEMSNGQIEYNNGKSPCECLIKKESFKEALQKVDVDEIMKQKKKPSLLSRLKDLYYWRNRKSKRQGDFL